MTMDEHLNREAWLNKMARMLRPWFSDHGYPLKGDLVVTMAALDKVLANHRYTRYDAASRKSLIFISAYDNIHVASHKTSGYGEDDYTVEICSTLCHEMLHAVMPTGEGHGKLWRKGCDAVGLVYPMTPQPQPKYAGAGRELRIHIRALLEHMPPLPNYGIKPPVKIGKGVGEGDGDGKSNKAMRYQCEACKVACVITMTALGKAGIPPCWNTNCASKDKPMKLANKRKG